MRLRSTRRLAFALVVAGGLAAPGPVSASEGDLRAGLAHLRAGAQAEAAQRLLKYRDAAPDPEVRRTIDRVLPLLRRPLAPDVREYIATTIEDSSTVRGARGPMARPEVLSRMFPVFP
jgi:hypothetical protein